MAEIRTKGLILKQTDFGEGNRMLTIFTENLGVVKAAVYGVRQKKSRNAAATQLLSYSDFMLFQGKSEVLSVNSVTALDSFFPLQEDLLKLSLASYLAEITAYFMEVNESNPPLLRLLLNTLYAIAYQNLDPKMAKAVYELRLASAMGYAPNLSACSACGEVREVGWFSAECGGAICPDCHTKHRDDLLMSPAAYRALYYILTAPEKKVFSFRVSPDVSEEIGRISEHYLLYCAETQFSSLTYLKNLLTIL